MNANIIKVIVMHYMKFSRSFICADEVYSVNGISDVLATNFKEIREFEIKTNKADLFNDLKKTKHLYIKNKNIKKYWLPNKFYYVVPDTLELDAKQLIYDTNINYGLLLIKLNEWNKGVVSRTGYPELSKYIHVAKNAKSIHKEYNEKHALQIYKRSCNSCIEKMQRLYIK